LCGWSGEWKKGFDRSVSYEIRNAVQKRDERYPGDDTLVNVDNAATQFFEVSECGFV
jgi:hypothetical protein